MILLRGLQCKKEFRPYTDMPKLLTLYEVPHNFKQERLNLLNLCVDSNDKFGHAEPLWKNEDFFIQLFFKLNEDINASKAFHLGIILFDLSS